MFFSSHIISCGCTLDLFLLQQLAVNTWLNVLLKSSGFIGRKAAATLHSAVRRVERRARPARNWLTSDATFQGLAKLEQEPETRLKNSKNEAVL